MEWYGKRVRGQWMQKITYSSEAEDSSETGSDTGDSSTIGSEISSWGKLCSVGDSSFDSLVKSSLAGAELSSTKTSSFASSNVWELAGLSSEEGPSGIELSLEGVSPPGISSLDSSETGASLGEKLLSSAIRRLHVKVHSEKTVVTWLNREIGTGRRTLRL
jgi:hypothetical protein